MMRRYIRLIALCVALCTWFAQVAHAAAEQTLPPPVALELSILDGLDMTTWSRDAMPFLCDVDQALSALSITRDDCETLREDEIELALRTPVKLKELDGQADLELRFSAMVGVYRLYEVATYVAVDEAGYPALTEQLDALMRSIDDKTTCFKVVAEDVPDLDSFKRAMSTLAQEKGRVGYGWTPGPVTRKQVFSSQFDVLAVSLKTDEKALMGAYPAFDGEDYLVSLRFFLRPAS